MGCSDSLLHSAFDFPEEFPSGSSSSKEVSLPWLVMLGMGAILVASASSNFKVFFRGAGSSLTEVMSPKFLFFFGSFFDHGFKPVSTPSRCS